MRPAFGRARRSTTRGRPKPRELWNTNAPWCAPLSSPWARESSTWAAMRARRCFISVAQPARPGSIYSKSKPRSRERLPDCRFVTGSVYELPFTDSAFDHVLVRDVIHHLEWPEQLVDEAARVLESGGRLDVLEPCRDNPLIFAHALAVKAERERGFSPRVIKPTVSRHERANAAGPSASSSRVPPRVGARTLARRRPGQARGRRGGRPGRALDASLRDGLHSCSRHEALAWSHPRKNGSPASRPHRRQGTTERGDQRRNWPLAIRIR